MTSTVVSAIVALPLMILARSGEQTARVDVYTAEQLTAFSSITGKQPASPLADAKGIVQRYPNHYTMLITRHEDGQSELHEHIADVFFVVDGQAQLWTGGSMENGNGTEPGEQRGSGLAGATSVSLQRGDVVHIPANVPHQLRLAHGGTFIYFVVKVSEGDASPQTHASH